MKRKIILLSLISILMFSNLTMQGIEVRGIQLQRKHIPLISAAIVGGAYLVGMGCDMYRNDRKWKNNLKDLALGTLTFACVGGVVGGALGYGASKIILAYQKIKTNTFGS